MRRYRKRGILIANVRNRKRGISAIKQEGKEKKKKSVCRIGRDTNENREVFANNDTRMRKNAGNINCRCKYRQRDTRELHGVYNLPLRLSRCNRFWIPSLQIFICNIDNQLFLRGDGVATEKTDTRLRTLLIHLVFEPKCSFNFVSNYRREARRAGTRAVNVRNKSRNRPSRCLQPRKDVEGVERGADIYIYLLGRLIARRGKLIKERTKQDSFAVSSAI